MLLFSHTTSQVPKLWIFQVTKYLVIWLTMVTLSKISNSKMVTLPASGNSHPYRDYCRTAHSNTCHEGSKIELLDRFQKRSKVGGILRG